MTFCDLQLSIISYFWIYFVLNSDHGWLKISNCGGALIETWNGVMGILSSEIAKSERACAPQFTTTVLKNKYLHTGCLNPILDNLTGWKWYSNVLYRRKQGIIIILRNHHLIWNISWCQLTLFLSSKFIWSWQAIFHYFF